MGMTQSPVDYDSFTFAVTTSKQQALPANPNRRVLILYNMSADTKIRVNFEDTIASYIELPFGDGLKLDVPPMNGIFVWVASGSANLTIVEG